MLEVKNIGYAVGNKWLVQDISYQFLPAKWYMLCGPNGAGKSTLLKLLGLELIPKTGSIAYQGQPVNYKEKSRYAKSRAVLSQAVDLSFPLLVEEVVMMGRYPHFDINPNKADLFICEAAMELLDVARFRGRSFPTLSGGEKQRVQFARTLAQIWEPPTSGCRMLLLDEPISALDLRYQFDFLRQVKSFLDDKTIVIAILHDLNLALNYADEILLLSDSRLYAAGKPGDVLSTENIQNVFHLDTRLHHLPAADFIWIK